jgi:hypothetical protein
VALAAGVLGLILAAGGAGAVSWNYMQHDNGFCTGCHVMAKPFGQFQARSGKHDTLQCHDCHQQSIWASTRQLVLWVAERPEKIGAHAKVANVVCARCHVDGADQREVWQRIATTAGHRTHLESDSSALAEVKCVTCHGAEVHKFVPVQQTCLQSGCHENTEIRLGKMAEQTSLHCVTCHQFTVELPKLATRDSAAGALTPSNKQCLSCHEMRAMLSSFDPARDPHSGSCGMCHNPHTQKVAEEAAQSCTTAGCHADWRTEPFHRGVAHRKSAESCLTCHQPHAAKVDASDCESCHATVRGAVRGGRRLSPPVPFDTSAALKRTASAAGVSDDAERGGGFLGWGWPTPPPDQDPVASPPADSFPHPKHARLACLTCHTSNVRHGRLTFERPRGCQICHHQAAATADCAACHEAGELAPSLPATLAISVVGRPVRTATTRFDHPAHREVRCLTCHVTPVSLEVDSTTRTCAGCHDQHHERQTSCATCHAGDWTKAHARPVDAHRGCADCHAERTIAALSPTRGFCLTCHRTEERHYPARECTVCHFLVTPEAYRSHLRKTAEERP